jgi:hypothetical protein
MVGGADWQPARMVFGETLAGLMAEVPKAMCEPAAMASVLRNSDELADLEVIAQSWFEDDPRVAQAVEQARGGDHAKLATYLLQSVMARRRDRWAEIILRTSLWMREAPEAADLCWRELAIVAKSTRGRTGYDRDRIDARYRIADDRGARGPGAKQPHGLLRRGLARNPALSLAGRSERAAEFRVIARRRSIAHFHRPLARHHRVAALACGDSQTFPAVETPARSVQGLFLSPRQRNDPSAGGGERWGHRVWLGSTTARGRGRERNPIKPARAGSATVIRIEHLQRFSTDSDPF